MGNFIQTAKSFKYAGGNDLYKGPVVVSDDSIYLTCESVMSAEKALKRKAGIVGHALAKLVEKEADPFDYLTPIPEEVLNDPNWPVKKEITTAIIINKNDAGTIKYPFWGALNVTVNEVNFSIMADFFSRKKVINIFKENEWNFK